MDGIAVASTALAMRALRHAVKKGMDIVTMEGYWEVICDLFFKPPHFVNFVSPLLSLKWLKLKVGMCVDHGKSLPSANKASTLGARSELCNLFSF